MKRNPEGKVISQRFTYIIATHGEEGEQLLPFLSRVVHASEEYVTSMQKLAKLGRYSAPSRETASKQLMVEGKLVCLADIMKPGSDPVTCE